MFDRLRGRQKDSKFRRILSPGEIGIVSASCCNPGAAPLDELLMRNAAQVARELGLERELLFETLTSAQRAIPSLKRSLDERQRAVVDQVATLFSTEGLRAFPVLFVDGEIAFYGGVPSVEAIRDHFQTRRS